jgi:hypothetical protein
MIQWHAKLNQSRLLRFSTAFASYLSSGPRHNGGQRRWREKQETTHLERLDPLHQLALFLWEHVNQERSDVGTWEPCSLPLDTEAHTRHC